MQIQVNTDSTIAGHEPLVEKIEAMISDGLSRFSDRITRIEVHVSDVNASKAGEDKRCLIEVRPNGLDPVVTSDAADTIEKAVRSAMHKMVGLLDSAFGKLSARQPG